MAKKKKKRHMDDVNHHKNSMRITTKYFMIVSGTASIALGAPSTFFKVFGADFGSAIIPFLFVFGGFVLWGRAMGDVP
jgi:hypothetical protein